MSACVYACFVGMHFLSLCVIQGCVLMGMCTAHLCHVGCVCMHAYYVGVCLQFLCVITCLHTHMCSAVLYNWDRGGSWCSWVLRKVTVDSEAMPESVIWKKGRTQPPPLSTNMLLDQTCPHSFLIITHCFHYVYLSKL